MWYGLVARLARALAGVFQSHWWMRKAVRALVREALWSGVPVATVLELAEDVGFPREEVRSWL